MCFGSDSKSGFTIVCVAKLCSVFRREMYLVALKIVMDFNDYSYYIKFSL